MLRLTADSAHISWGENNDGHLVEINIGVYDDDGDASCWIPKQ